MFKVAMSVTCIDKRHAVVAFTLIKCRVSTEHKEVHLHGSLA